MKPAIQYMLEMTRSGQDHNPNLRLLCNDPEKADAECQRIMATIKTHSAGEKMDAPLVLHVDGDERTYTPSGKVESGTFGAVVSYVNDADATDKFSVKVEERAPFARNAYEIYAHKLDMHYLEKRDGWSKISEEARADYGKRAKLEAAASGCAEAEMSRDVKDCGMVRVVCLCPGAYNSDNIDNVADIDSSVGPNYYMMPTLEKLPAIGSRCDFHKLGRILLEVQAQLGCAFEKQKPYMDIKAENVMYDPVTKCAVVVDLGSMVRDDDGTIGSTYPPPGCRGLVTDDDMARLGKHRCIRWQLAVLALSLLPPITITDPKGKNDHLSEAEAAILESVKGRKLLDVYHHSCRTSCLGTQQQAAADEVLCDIKRLLDKELVAESVPWTLLRADCSALFDEIARSLLCCFDTARAPDPGLFPPDVVSTVSRGYETIPDEVYCERDALLKEREAVLHELKQLLKPERNYFVHVLLSSVSSVSSLFSEGWLDDGQLEKRRGELEKRLEEIRSNLMRIKWTYPGTDAE